VTAEAVTRRALGVERSLLHRWPESRLEPSLDRIRAVTEVLGRPQDAVPVVHVTGTNGKTTTSRMIDDLLRASGLRVGRYTSPHLESMRERIVLDGKPVDADTFATVHDRLLPVVHEAEAAGSGPLSFFEVLTAMAFQTFAQADLDAVVVEVGMGGTWDATNVADARVAVVTPIHLDHTEFLGPDVAAIATEKAGIIKPGSVAVLADQPPSARRILVDRASAVGADVLGAGWDTRILRRLPSDDGQSLDLRGLHAEHRDVVLPLLGAHQAGNAAVAVTAAEAVLTDRNEMLPSDTVRAVLARVRSPGRLETVRTSPRVWVDASHNPAGMVATAAAIRELPSAPRVIVVVAALEGKDVSGMLRALDGVASEVVVNENGSPRCLPAEALASVAAEVLGRDRISVRRDLGDALEAASRRAAETDAAVLVTGSVVTAGEAGALVRAGSFP
jgi:dihydrofolate synthase/folylpolyglutamate synthase